MRVLNSTQHYIIYLFFDLTYILLFFNFRLVLLIGVYFKLCRVHKKCIEICKRRYAAAITASSVILGLHHYKIKRG